MYTSYITKEEFVGYSGISLADLPPDIDQVISKASDMITNLIIVEIKPEHDEALRLATASQVEYWLTSGGDQLQNAGTISSYSAGSVSVTYEQGASPRQLCSRANGYLGKAGLLYRGVKFR